MKTIFHNATRGGLYSIALLQHEDGTYCIKEYKHGQEQGAYWMGNANVDRARFCYNQRVEEAAKYDGIFYTEVAYTFVRENVATKERSDNESMTEKQASSRNSALEVQAAPYRWVKA